MSKFKYLIKVNSNVNNNKFYKMIDNGNYFEVQYGRVGGVYQSKKYPINKWDSTYKSKLKKGYVDKTDLVANKIKDTQEDVQYDVIPNNIVREIVEKLQSLAKKAISENYNISSNMVTQKMIDEAQNSIYNLMNAEDIKEFNDELIKLFMIIPRKMTSVKSYLANSKDDFKSILSGEQDLLDVMKGQVKENELDQKTNANKINKTILESMGIEILPTTKNEEIFIKQQLDDVSNKYSDSWRVINRKSQKRYNKFIQEENITNKKTLWHGTRSENVWSILNNGLILRPNAIITGKMFGHGIYFASKAKKSLGYTSLGGSYWTKGKNSEGYMLLFDVAYGDPYTVYDFDSKYYNLNYDKLQKFQDKSNCLHAKSDKGMLRNDEIVVYKEEQINVSYLVELKN